ncbi:MAG TPA: metallophosphoesterase [Chlamydiales bacterium]|nr:metallophosphoesterase [Chlamydiales bacterium]
MTQILWMSDLHFDSAEEEVRKKFFHALHKINCDVTLISGDIADGPKSLKYLKALREHIKGPIYFILGNHDFYGLAIDIHKKRAQEFAAAEANLYYLTTLPFVSLNETTALVGHDGWADAGEGTFLLSTVCLRDYFEIVDLKGRAPKELEEKLHELGKEAALQAEQEMRAALEKHQKVIFLTHAPPFREACLFEGNITNDDWAPHFVDKAMGQMLRCVMEQHPDKSCLVLSGHTHHEAERQILPNLAVRVAHAEYGDPRYQLLTM